MAVCPPSHHGARASCFYANVNLALCETLHAQYPSIMVSPFDEFHNALVMTPNRHLIILGQGGAGFWSSSGLMQIQHVPLLFCFDYALPLPWSAFNHK
jgi:hypothetical protein